jgi:thiamine biosynthesis protein ThiS
MNICISRQGASETAFCLPLLIEFGLSEERINFERNRNIIRKAADSSIRFEDGDNLEIVQFVGGG